MVSDNKTLDKVYTAENSEELMDAYKDWAAKYDDDTVQSFGYVAHIESAKALDKVLDKKECRILDAGCGTGLVAEELSKMGYTQMDALDYSKEMLDIAAEKKLYQAHIQADLNAPLDMADNSYDAVVCTGTFTYGHVKPQAFNELVRVIKPEGIVCFTIRQGAFEDYDYRAEMLKMEKDKKWELLEMQDADYLKNEGVQCKMCTYRVTK